jgi:hypothetical protein
MLAWTAAHNVRFLQTEKKVYSRTYDYCGTMDGLAYCDSCTNPRCCPRFFRNRLSLIDWKTSNYLYLIYLLQTAAYQHAFTEEHNCHIEDRWLIRLDKDDGTFDPWHVEEFDQDTDFAAFVTALDLSRLMRSLKGRIKLITDDRREFERAKQQAARRAERLIDCGKEGYKGVTKIRPKCVEMEDGHKEPCQKCLTIWKGNHPNETETPSIRI